LPAATHEVAIADKVSAQNIIKEYIKNLQETRTQRFITNGSQTPLRKPASAVTARHTAAMLRLKLGVGSGVVDFPDRAGIHHDVFAARVEKGLACWHCPLRCKAVLKQGEESTVIRPGATAPNTKQLLPFGSLCLNNNTDANYYWPTIFATGRA